MIHFIVGKRNAEFEKTLQKVLLGFGKNNDIERHDASSEPIENILDGVQTESLFGTKKVFVLSNLFEDEDRKKIFTSKLSELATASNGLVVLLESLLAADTKKVERFAEIHKIVDKEKKEAAFNPFVLANVFASGDKKKTWITFQEVVQQSEEVEPIHGMIWWKLKDMIQKRSGYSSPQLRDMARKLVAVYHESRLGGLGMQERLEEFFLTLPEVKK